MAARREARNDGGGVAFRTSSLWPAERTPEWVVWLDWELVHGRLECVGVEVTSRHASLALRPFRPVLLQKRLRLGDLVRRERHPTLAGLARAGTVRAELTPSRSSTLWPTDPTPQWVVLLDWEVLGGRLECVGVEMTSRHPQLELTPFKATALQQGVRLGDLIRRQRPEVLAGLLREVAVTRDEDTIHKLEQVGYQLRDEGPDGRTMADPAETYLRVAEVYASAVGSDRRPMEAVAEKFHVDPSVAGRWIDAARVEYQYLEPGDGRLTVKAIRLGADVMASGS